VVVMEPLLGGSLAAPPASVQAVWDRSPVRRGPVEWALHWLWNQPEVSVVLSGMSSAAQVEENISYAARSAVGLLSSQELALIEEARAQYESLTVIPCSSCRYYMPCPQHVDIPENLTSYNDGVKYDKHEEACSYYRQLEEAYRKGDYTEDIRAAKCISCGECEEKCPQNIPISRWMPVIHEVLAGKKPFVKKL
jgi:predicted aldo/keto reductase-like oxidoreductase